MRRLISWLGQGVRSEECLIPREVDLSGCSLDLQRVKKIVGGAGHTLILNDDGHVFSCGWNNKGQAGFPETEDALEFRMIGGNLKNRTVVDVACGWDSSAALTVEGDLFLWGSNCFGQLGWPVDTLRWTNEPFLIESDRRIERVSMGLRHTAVVTEDHKVLVCGAGSKGQLGLSQTANGDRTSVRHTFMEVPAVSNVADVVCGQHHTIAITEERDLYVFGDNKHGQLGLDPKKFSRIMSPMKLTAPIFDSEFDSTEFRMNSGWSHVLLLREGDIFSWGRNTYGQLGCPESQRPTAWMPEKIGGTARIRQIALGSEHNVVLAEDGSILSWGWNEHGNCGNGSTLDVWSPTRLPLAFQYVATLVGCGAGHSMAIIHAP